MRERIWRGWLTAVIATVAWGAGAFGSPYPWAYLPLLIASVCLGIVGLWKGAARLGRIAAVIACLAILCAAVAAQLLPLPADLVRVVSPSREALETTLYVPQARALQPLTISPAHTRLALLFLACFSLLLVGSARMFDEYRLRQFAVALTVFGVVMAATAIVQKAAWSGKIYGFWEPPQAGDGFGPFINRNHFAGWMLMTIPVSIGLLAQGLVRNARSIGSTLRERVIWLSTPQANQTALICAAVTLMCASVLLTTSRSGILGVLGIGFAFVWVAPRSRAAGHGSYVFPAVLAVLLIAAIAWAGTDRISRRFLEGSITGRLEIWKDGLAVVNQFWLTGTGTNTYRLSMLKFQDASDPVHFSAAHNDYLQIASEGGLLTGIPVLALIFFFARTVRRDATCDRGSSAWLRTGVVIGLIAIGCQSVVEFSLQMPGNAVLFAILCGAALIPPTGRLAERASAVS